jgi:predicted small secreted protein
MKLHNPGKSLAMAALAALTLTATAACNTVKGAGEDISSVGRAGERAIKK